MTDEQKSSEALIDYGNLTVTKLTKIFTKRKKAGLIVSNSAKIPEWMTEMELPSELIEQQQREKPMVFANNPSKGTFTDGYAMYNTFNSVENCNTKFVVNVDGFQFAKYLQQLFAQVINQICYKNINILTKKIV